MGGATTTSNGNNQVDQPFSRRIALAIKSQDGDIVYYRVAPDKKIQEVLKNYCEGKNFKYREMTFLHNGGRFQTSKTIIELGIEDGTEIDAMSPQGGGGNLTTFP